MDIRLYISLYGCKLHFAFRSSELNFKLSFKLLQHDKLTAFIDTDEDVVHRKYFCVNNHLVSLVELLLEAEENFLHSV